MKSIFWKVMSILIVIWLFLFLGVILKIIKKNYQYEGYNESHKVDDLVKNIILGLKGEQGKYQIFMHNQFIKGTYLLNTVNGRVWALYEDPADKHIWWHELDVENLKVDDHKYWKQKSQKEKENKAMTFLEYLKQKKRKKER